MYSKNKYYTEEDINTAKELADRFYKKQYTPVLLKSGNLKLGSNVAIWDLPSIITCKYKCKGCYAIKPERIYKSTRVSRAFKYEIIKQALKNKTKREYLQQYINVELSRHRLLYKLPVVRLHSSGDFFSKKYLEFWFEIINRNKDIRFYTYTKVLDNETIDKYNSTFTNFNIVKSLIDNKINYGTIEYIESIAKTLDARGEVYRICDYGIGENSTRCMGIDVQSMITMDGLDYVR